MLEMNVGTLIDKAVARYKHKTAVKMGDESITYAQLGENSNRFANALLNLGVQHGDRIAVLMWNAIEYLYVDYGAAKIGAVKVPLNHMLVKEDIDFRMKDSEPCMAVVDDHFLPMIMELKEENACLKEVICISSDSDSLPPGVHSFNRLLNDASAEKPDIEVGNEDLLALMYTGGTTGVSKGVMHTHKSFVSIVYSEAFEWGLLWDEVMLVMAPLPHATGFQIPAIFIKGGMIIVTKGFDPEEMCRLVEKEKVTWAFMVPTMIYILLDFPDRKKYDLSSLRSIAYGAAPMSPDRLRRAMEEIGPVFMQGYAQMEVANQGTSLTREDHLEAFESHPERLKSCGQTVIMAQLRIVDDDGKDVPVGEVGEIAIKGPHMMKGYWRRDEDTTKTVRNGWIHTGDMARMDEDGFVYIVDRKKDMIISGGLNVYSAEVEYVLMRHPALAQAAVIGIPDEKWGEAIKAVVVLREGHSVTLEELTAFCREYLSAYKRPKSIEISNEIPMTPYGKVDKKAMRSRYWAGQERAVH